MRTSDSYQKEVLEKYKKDRGGAMMSGFLINPTRSRIREACLWLLERRKEKDDEYILNRFFQFKEGENRARHIQGLKSEKADKFVPVINFLKGRVQKTSPENIELISWLIDFKPRPYQEYLKSYNLISELGHSKLEDIDKQKGSDINRLDKFSKKEKEIGKKKLPETKRNEEKKKKRSRIITISISVTFAMTILILGMLKWNANHPNSILKETECMTWADSLYVTISCDQSPLSKYGTQVKPIDKMKLKNMRKVEVSAGYKFFSEDGKPLIWYYKNKENKHEFFTSPGLHPVNGETLRKITPYIIQTYVPLHTKSKNSFVQ
ncbi:MAG: hypothetical protein WBB27_01975 [Maribacter sp.]